MRTLLFSIIVLSTTFPVYAQTAQLTKDFAQLGSHWYFTNIPSFFSQTQDYMEIKSVGDTIIQGKNCRHLQKTYNGFNERDEFVYFSGDTVYRLADNDTFYVLYNYGAQVGDSWLARSSLYTDGSPEEEMTITVDSVSSEIINGFLLRVLFVSSNHSAISFGGSWPPSGRARIIERLGGSWYMFPFNYGFLDDHIRLGLRCYSDDSLGFYNAGITQTCDEVITSTNDEGVPSSITIYPNPFSNHVTFRLTDIKQKSISIFNSIGQQILVQTFSISMTINTEHFPDGIYFYELYNDKNIIAKGKIVKQ